MAVEITAPASITGAHTFGPVTLSFEDGVAVAEELPKMLRSYMEQRGYTVKTKRKAAKPKGGADETEQEVQDNGD